MNFFYDSQAELRGTRVTVRIARSLSLPIFVLGAIFCFPGADA
jgi:hypothetical protein